MKKPTVPAVGNLTEQLRPIGPLLEALRENVQVVTGRRNNKLAKLNVRKHVAAGASPTKAEFDALAADVAALATTLNQLIDRFDL